MKKDLKILTYTVNDLFDDIKTSLGRSNIMVEISKDSVEVLEENGTELSNADKVKVDLVFTNRGNKK